MAAVLVVTTPVLLPSLSTMWAEVTRPKVAPPMSIAMKLSRSALTQKTGMLERLTVGSARIAIAPARAGTTVCAFGMSDSLREAGAARRPRLGMVVQVAGAAAAGGGGGGGW